MCLLMGDFVSLDGRLHISGFYKGLVWAESTDWCENVHQGKPPPPNISGKAHFLQRSCPTERVLPHSRSTRSYPSPVGRFGHLSGSFQPSKDRLLRPTVGLKVTDGAWQLQSSLSMVLEDLEYLTSVSPPLSSWHLTPEDHIS